MSAKKAPAKKAAKKQAQSKKEKGKPGRPSLYSDAMGKEICDLVASGSNLTRISKIQRFPSVGTLFGWLTDHPEFSERYACARELRADARADRIDEICEKLEKGKLEANTARVLIDAEKWQAGKERPGRYGDKLDVTQTTKVAPLTDEELAAQMRQSPAYRRAVERMLAKTGEAPSED